MRKVRDYSSEMEAHIACEFLRSNDLTAETRGSREYSSIVSGKDEGRYDLLVADDDFGKAMTLLNQIESSTSQTQTPVDAMFYYKKTIVSAVVAMTLLPIIFNFASIKNLILYRQTETNMQRRLIFTLIAWLAQIPAFLVAYYVLEGLSKGNSIFHFP